MLQIEALVQMSALSILSLPGNKGKVVYLTNANNLKFLKKITPNNRLIIETKTKSFTKHQLAAKASVLLENRLLVKLILIWYCLTKLKNIK